MKRIDVTKSVMEQVTKFEKKRSTWWLWGFRILLNTLLVLIFLVLWWAWMQLQNSRTLDLLELFRQDMEIIREFWQDTIMVFVEELPREALFIAVLILIMMGILLWVSQRKRKIVNRRIQELAKRNHA